LMGLGNVLQINLNAGDFNSATAIVYYLPE